MHGATSCLHRKAAYRAVTRPCVLGWIKKRDGEIWAGQARKRASGGLLVVSRHALAVRFGACALSCVRVFRAGLTIRAAAAEVTIAVAPLRRLPAIVARCAAVHRPQALHVIPGVTSAVRCRIRSTWIRCTLRGTGFARPPLNPPVLIEACRGRRYVILRASEKSKYVCALSCSCSHA